MDCVEYAKHLSALYQAGWRYVVRGHLLLALKGEDVLARYLDNGEHLLPALQGADVFVRYLDSGVALAVALAAEGVPFIDYSSPISRGVVRHYSSAGGVRAAANSKEGGMPNKFYFIDVFTYSGLHAFVAMCQNTMLGAYRRADSQRLKVWRLTVGQYRQIEEALPEFEVEYTGRAGDGYDVVDVWV